MTKPPPNHAQQKMSDRMTLRPGCRLLVLFLFTTLLSPHGAALAQTNASDAAMAGFGAFAREGLKDWNVPGMAMAIVRDDRIIYAEGFGFRNIEENLPVTTNTLFAVGSTTKAITTFVMGTLVDEGKLDWDKPVRRYLPELRLYDPQASESITPRDLVTHRSGLPRHDLVWYNNTNLTRGEIVQRLAYLEPSESFRAKYQYNNLMYVAAGYLVEQITGRTWEENVQQRVLAPLGMKRSNFSVRTSQSDNDFALPYEEKKDKIKRMAFRNIDVVGPAGSINSSIFEMSQWLRVNLSKGKFSDHQLITAVTLADIHTPHMTTGASVERPEISQGAYGLGWFVDSYRGHRRISHSGGIDGFTARVTLLPDDNLGLVVLANIGATGLPTVITQHAIDRLLNLSPIDWEGEALAKYKKRKEADKESEATKETQRKPGTKPSHALPEYTGEYDHPGYGIIRIGQDSDRLLATFNTTTTPLEHWHYDIFNAPERDGDEALANTRFNFQTDLDGNISTVAIQLAPQVKEIVFTKKPNSTLSDTNYIVRFTGKYDLSGHKLTIGLKGALLTLDIPGEPQYQLVPNLDGGFTLKEAKQLSLKFVTDNSGKVTSALFKRPSGVVTILRLTSD
jgi:CubicO group peptidase (beta-lactamase class C family)